MPPSCSICTHPKRVEIDAELRSGTSLRNVAKRFEVSVSAVNRHKAHAGDESRRAADEGVSDRGGADSAGLSGGASRALGPVRGPSGRGSQNPGAREAETQICAEDGPIRQAKSLAGRARPSEPRRSVEERAKEVDPTDVEARINFLESLGPDYERGVTPALCAQVWGMKVSTIEGDATEAWRRIRKAADPDDDRAKWWGVMYDELERSRQDLARVREAIESYTDPEDKKLKVQPMDLKFIGDALKGAATNVLALTEQLGKASGAISTGPSLTINLENPQTPNDKRLRAQLDARDGVLLDALTQALGELVADRALRGRVLTRVADLMQPGARPGDDAVVVQTIGGR